MKGGSWVETMDKTSGFFSCCRSCPVSLQDRYYINPMRLRLLEPRLLHSRRLKPVSASLLEDKHSNYKRLLHLLRSPISEIDALPIFANIDPSNICNLHCLFCPVGTGELTHQRTFMSLGLYERILERLGPSLIFLELYRYGEPLLNPAIVKMVSLASHQYRIFCSISTNFAMRLSDDMLRGLVESGLYKLIIAADDVEQSHYERYRIGGQIDIVKHNLERLIQIKRRAGSRYPRIVWQTLIFRFNEDRLKTIERNVRRFGVDGFRAVPAYIPKYEKFYNWIPLSTGMRGNTKHRPRPITNVVLNPVTLSPRQPFEIRCQVKNNTGNTTWPAEHGDDGSIRIGIKLLDASGNLIYEMGRIYFRKPVAPGEELSVGSTLTAPHNPGRYYMKIDIVKENYFWFEYNNQIQTQPFVIKLQVLPQEG